MVIDDFLWNLQSSGVVKGGPSAVGWLQLIDLLDSIWFGNS